MFYEKAKLSVIHISAISSNYIKNGSSQFSLNSVNLSDSASACSRNLLLLFLKVFSTSRYKNLLLHLFECNFCYIRQLRSDHSSLLICVELPITVDIDAAASKSVFFCYDWGTESLDGEKFFFIIWLSNEENGCEIIGFDQKSYH